MSRDDRAQRSGGSVVHKAGEGHGNSIGPHLWNRYFGSSCVNIRIVLSLVVSMHFIWTCFLSGIERSAHEERTPTTSFALVRVLRSMRKCSGFHN